MRSPKTTWICFFILVCAFLLIYGFSASRTVIWDDKDAAEFQTVGAVGGILHQPYPLWCAIARLFSALPFGEPAFRITLLSIVFSALAIGLLFLLLHRRTKNYPVSIGAAFAFGLSFTYWQFSSLPEIYALTTFLFIASLYLIDRLWTNDSPASAILLALVFGLLLSQQTLNVAAVPGLILLILVSKRVRRQLFAKRLFVVRLAAFFLPFGLYLYTILVDRGSYPMNWFDQYGQYVAQAQAVNESQMDSVLGRFRFQMWVGRLESTLLAPGDCLPALYSWLRHFFSVEFPFVAAVFASVGFVSLFRRDARNQLFLITLITPYLMLALCGLGETYAYSLPVYAVCTLFVADGIAAVGRAPRGISWAKQLVMVMIAFLVAIMPILRYATASPLARLFRPADVVAAIDSSTNAFFHLKARNDLGKEYGIKVAELVEPGSLIFGRWREANVLFYHKYVEGRFPDVDVSYTLPAWDQIAEVIEQSRPSEIYFTHPPQELNVDIFKVKQQHEILPGVVLYAVRVKAFYARFP